MENLILAVEKRTIVGKKVSSLRREGVTPLHLYGSGIVSQSLQCDTAVVGKLINQAGTNIPITLTVEGDTGENVCFVREVQYHPVTDRLVHVDFMKVDVNRVVRAQVPIAITGLSPAVRHMGGTLLQPLQTVTVEALPMNIPPSYSLDAELIIDFDTNLFVSDLESIDGVSIINDEGELVAGVVAPRIEAELEIEVGEGEEGEEGTESEEGEGSGGESGTEENSDNGS